MKLWQKIFLSTLALMVSITALSSVLLLRSTRDALWQREQQRAITQQQYMAGILKAGILNQRLRLGVVLLQEDQTRETAIQTLEQQATDDYLAGLTPPKMTALPSASSRRATPPGSGIWCAPCP